MSPGVGFSIGLDTMIVKVSTMSPEQAAVARERSADLLAARKDAGMSVAQAAEANGLTEIEYQALESGTQGYMIPDGWDRAIAALYTP